MTIDCNGGIRTPNNLSEDAKTTVTSWFRQAGKLNEKEITSLIQTIQPDASLSLLIKHAENIRNQKIFDIKDAYSGDVRSQSHNPYLMGLCCSQLLAGVAGGMYFGEDSHGKSSTQSVIATIASFALGGVSSRLTYEFASPLDRLNAIRAEAIKKVEIIKELHEKIVNAVDDTRARRRELERASYHEMERANRRVITVQREQEWQYMSNTMNAMMSALSSGPLGDTIRQALEAQAHANAVLQENQAHHQEFVHVDDVAGAQASTSSWDSTHVEAEDQTLEDVAAHFHVVSADEVRQPEQLLSAASSLGLPYPV